MYGQSPLGPSTVIQGAAAYPKTAVAILCCATLIAGFAMSGPSSKEIQACYSMENGVRVEHLFDPEDADAVEHLAGLSCEVEVPAPAPVFLTGEDSSCPSTPVHKPAIKKVHHKKKPFSGVRRFFKKHTGPKKVLPKRVVPVAPQCGIPVNG